MKRIIFKRDIFNKLIFNKRISNKLIFNKFISNKRISNKLISIIVTAIVTVLSVSLLTACGPSQAEIDESIALESAEARLAKAESESESLEESIAESKAAREAKEAKENRPANYTPTDEEKELICGDWYRSKDDGEGDTDLYWLTMDEKGYCKFMHETMNSSEPIDDLEGTWSVDDHSFVNIDLGKYKGKFRFMKNSYGSTNIICNDGDDFVESGEEGAYAAFIPVKWYAGNLRFVEKEDGADTEADAAASGTATDPKEDGATETAAETAADTATASEETRKIITVEMQGEGDSWYRLAGVEGLCKVDVDTREGEIPARLALNQNDHLVVKIQQIRQ